MGGPAPAPRELPHAFKLTRRWSRPTVLHPGESDYCTVRLSVTSFDKVPDVAMTFSM